MKNCAKAMNPWKRKLMRNKWKSGATTGAEFETKFNQWLHDANIEFYEDKTLSTGKRRRKDIKCDRRLIIDDKEVFVELKSTTSKQALDYRLYNDGLNHKIKFHQISKMNWLIVNYHDTNETYAITKKQFLWFTANHKKNSIAYKDVKEIGKVITGTEWLK